MVNSVQQDGHLQQHEDAHECLGQIVGNIQKWLEATMFHIDNIDKWMDNINKWFDKVIVSPKRLDKGNLDQNSTSLENNVKIKLHGTCGKQPL